MKAINRTATLTIAVGNTAGKATIDDIPRGSQFFVGAIAKPAPDQLVRLGIWENGQRLQDAIDISWYDGKQGSFSQRALELDYGGGTKLEFQANTDTAIAGSDLQIEIVIQGWVDKNC